MRALTLWLISVHGSLARLARRRAAARVKSVFFSLVRDLAWIDKLFISCFTVEDVPRRRGVYMLARNRLNSYRCRNRFISCIDSVFNESFCFVKRRISPVGSIFDKLESPFTDRSLRGIYFLCARDVRVVNKNVVRCKLLVFLHALATRSSSSSQDEANTVNE